MPHNFNRTDVVAPVANDPVETFLKLSLSI